MDDQQAFMNAIIADVDNDLPRLVFADWLEEHGEPDRAEFIRVQCELASLPADAPHRPQLEAREAELLGRYGYEWAEEFRGQIDEFTYHRGFIERVEIALAGTTTKRVLSLFRRQPFRHVCVIRRDEPLIRFAEVVTHLPENRITGLELRELRDYDETAVNLVLTAPALSKLRTLVVGCNSLMPPILAPITRALQSPSSGYIEVLGVTSVFGITPSEVMDAVGNSSHLTALHTLFLAWAGLDSHPIMTPDQLREFGRSANLSNLRHLSLQHTTCPAEHWHAIRAWPFLPRLDRLWLSKCRLGSSVERFTAPMLASLPEWREAFDSVCPRVDWTTPFLHPWDSGYFQRGLRWDECPPKTNAVRHRKS